MMPLGNWGLGLGLFDSVRVVPLRLLSQPAIGFSDTIWPSLFVEVPGDITLLV